MKFTIQHVVYVIKQSVLPKMFTNERLFTIQPLTITRFDCTYAIVTRYPRVFTYLKTFEISNHGIKFVYLFLWLAITEVSKNGNPFVGVHFPKCGRSQSACVIVNKIHCLLIEFKFRLNCQGLQYMCYFDWRFLDSISFSILPTCSLKTWIVSSIFPSKMSADLINSSPIALNFSPRSFDSLELKNQSYILITNQIPFKNVLTTSASNGSLLEWKIALFHQKRFLVYQFPL